MTRSINERIKKYNINVEEPYTLLAYLRCQQPQVLERYILRLLQKRSLNGRELFSITEREAVDLFKKIDEHIEVDGRVMYEKMQLCGLQ